MTNQICSQCGGTEDQCAARRCWGFVNGQRKKSYLAELRARKNTDLPAGWRYNQDLIESTEDLKRELEISDRLLAQHKRLMEAIPQCPMHGECIPHAIEWVEAAKARDTGRPAHGVPSGFSVPEHGLPGGWRCNQDKDGRFAEYQHGDAIMRADDKMWIVRVGLNTESGKCQSIESGIESARICLLRRVNLAIKALGCEVKL